MGQGNSARLCLEEVVSTMKATGSPGLHVRAGREAGTSCRILMARTFAVLTPASFRLVRTGKVNMVELWGQMLPPLLSVSHVSFAVTLTD